MIEAEILLDSLSPTGIRLTTFRLKCHRCIIPELNTHRDFSRNSASSRAIPVKKIIDQVKNDPALPVFWGKNQPGMAADEELTDEQKNKALANWLAARDAAVFHATNLIEIGLHKQLANRILEPWMWTQVILTATSFGNFFNLRTDKGAQPEIRALAIAMVAAMKASTPKKLDYGEWHLPLVFDHERVLPIEDKKALSVARCARVSYLNHDGTNSVLEKDKALHDMLMSNGHMSPFEHQATPYTGRWGNFEGWKQYRKFIPNENRTGFDLEGIS